MNRACNFKNFIAESSRLTKLGLMGLTPDQKEFLDKCTDGTWEYDLATRLVNISGDFSCARMNLTDFIGIRFGRISGYFNCSWNDLENLEGSPYWVGEFFNCSYNKLTTLKGAPKRVNGSFMCEFNDLTNLEGGPESIGSFFNCNHNPLPNLKGKPKQESNRAWLSRTWNEE